MSPFLHGNMRRDVLPPVPVYPVRRRRQCIPEAADLLCLIIAPGRVSGLGDPDLRSRIVTVKNGPHIPQVRLVPKPAAGFTVPGSGKSVEADSGNGSKDAALAHQREPVR